MLYCLTQEQLTRTILVHGISHPFLTDLLYLCRDIMAKAFPAETVDPSGAFVLADAVRIFMDANVRRRAGIEAFDKAVEGSGFMDIKK